MHLQKGQLVRSKAGRDRKRTFAVLAQEGQLLLLSDGATRPLAHPKRKKLMHLTPTATVLHSEALTDDQQLREAIAAYDGASEDELFEAAAEAAAQGAEDSKNFVSKFGRAKSYGAKTIGTPDAGAVSMACFFRGLARK